MSLTEEKRLRLLYLGFAFPPGVQAHFPGINPAGHALETQMVAHLRRHFELRSVGLLPQDPPILQVADPDSGVEHNLLLVERSPEVWHRYVSLVRLKQEYRQWSVSGWTPDLVLVYNLSPVYNQFLLWLKRQAHAPKLVLLLLDSPNLGQTLPWLKRTRRRLKPMIVADSEMITQFDACIALSTATEHYFTPRRVPFLWMPGGCSPVRALSNPKAGAMQNRPVRFGYFGALGAHAGVKQLVKIFSESRLQASLELCGYGKAAAELEQIAKHDQRIKFRGLLTPAQCLEFGRECDVLVNPRPPTHGNENNFASKLFDYALTGSAILTSRISGVEKVLGPDAYYIEVEDFDASLARNLDELTKTPRLELARRGAAVQGKVLGEFSWAEQARRMAVFMEQLAEARTQQPVAAELAA